MIPFLTEEVWQLLGELAPERGLAVVGPAAESVMVAAWPEGDPAREDAEIEAQFAQFQGVLRAVRDVRSRQNVPDRKPVDFAVRCDPEAADRLRPMEPYFASLAWARAVDWGPAVESPRLSANVTLAGIEVFVDLAELIDVEAEMARKQKELEKRASLIAAKQKKLANKRFIERAPEAVVQKERDGLEALEQQQAGTMAVLESLAALDAERKAGS
jgi:valyl-tRNA synthetase